MMTPLQYANSTVPTIGSRLNQLVRTCTTYNVAWQHINYSTMHHVSNVVQYGTRMVMFRAQPKPQTPHPALQQFSPAFKSEALSPAQRSL
jgi:hypothetical protein